MQFWLVLSALAAQIHPDTYELPPRIEPTEKVSCLVQEAKRRELERKDPKELFLKEADK